MDLSIVPHNKMQQLMRSDRHMFATSDDHAMLKQVEATHDPDGRQFAVKPLLHIIEDIDHAMLKEVEATHVPDGRQFAVKPLLHIIEDIFQRAAPSVPGFVQQESTQAQRDLMDDKAYPSDFFDMLDLLSFTINKVSCEISCKCSGGGDARATTLGIFNTLASYTWDAKVVLAMAAFALNYGEFWFVAQLYPTNLLAKSVALLKQLPEILERAGTLLKSKFEALRNLVKAMLDVAKCIIEFKELPAQYITPDTPEMVTATAHIPTAVYCTIQSIVACAAQIMGLVGMGHAYIVSTAESWELSTLAHKVNSIHTHLKNQLILCYKIIDEKRYIETYQALVRQISRIDNMMVLRELIYAMDDQLPIFEGSTGRRVGHELLMRKNVLLLISDLDVSHDELFILEKMYHESRQNPTRTGSQYEVVWMPVLDRTAPWTEEKQQRFETLQRTMPWYSIHHPSMVNPVVIRYVKEFWHFKKKPILVVLDPQGRVVNTNALHMMWIWGNLAFPFTSSREEVLWREESWRLELLADSVHASIHDWIDKKSLVCLYGGEDIEWIRKFTATAKSVARVVNITLEMLYVGKSNPKEKINRNNDIIGAESLSNTLQDLPHVWFFWVRLESMWHSKMKHVKSVETDPILQEIVTMLSFDGLEHCWAVFCIGAEHEMAKAKGETIMQCFTDFDLWKKKAESAGFLPALIHRLKEIQFPDEALVRLMETSHNDNMKVLRALIYAEDDQLPLIEGSTERRVSLDVLRRKNVLLLITDLDVSLDELMILEQIFRESRLHSTRTESQYEVVWMPVMDSTAQSTEEKQQKFEYVQGMVPWYSIHHPSMVDPAVIRYIKEFWHFKKKPILVVIDLQGKVVNTNALHMMWIWGTGAFPFTSAREEALWREEAWRLELLADTIDANIPSWIDKKSLVCLYGGEDIEWIRNFTATAKKVARDAGITLEMLYVGKGNPKDKVKKINATIVSENLSHTLEDIRFIWFFWVRLESMWHSKMKQGMSAENDPILQEIVTMLSFDGSEHCWAVFCLGDETEMAKAKGDTIMKCLTDFEAWKKNAEDAGFLPALIYRLKEIQRPPGHCNRLILPGITGTIPDRVVCSECNKLMERFIIYRCCDE